MDERLQQLLTETQQYAPQSQEWQSALMRLVDEILRSRKLCRPLPNKPLFGVYQKIYEQVRQQLWCDVAQKIDRYEPKQKNAREWANILRFQAFQKILDDAQLKKLAIEAQCHPPNTELRQYALGELVEAIRLSGRLCHPHRKNFSSQFYDLLYDEAVNKTLTYVCRKIDNYDPERGDKKFMNWVNFKLDKMLLEVYHEEQEPNITDLPSLAELEKIVRPEEPPSSLEILRDCLEEDPQNLYKQTHIRDRPDVSFFAIALARITGKSWQEISEKFGIPLATINRFFQRCCEKFRFDLRKCMGNIL